MSLKIGNKVCKVTGDYPFVGTVQGLIITRNGNVRYVVENYDGILHIFSRKNLEKM